MSTMTATAKGQLEQKKREQEEKRVAKHILYINDRNSSANATVSR